MYFFRSLFFAATYFLFLLFYGFCSHFLGIFFAGLVGVFVIETLFWRLSTTFLSFWRKTHSDTNIRPFYQPEANSIEKKIYLGWNQTIRLQCSIGDCEFGETYFTAIKSHAFQTECFNRFQLAAYPVCRCGRN